MLLISILVILGAIRGCHGPSKVRDFFFFAALVATGSKMTVLVGSLCSEGCHLPSSWAPRRENVSGHHSYLGSLHPHDLMTSPNPHAAEIPSHKETEHHLPFLPRSHQHTERAVSKVNCEKPVANWVSLQSPGEGFLTGLGHSCPG